MQKSSLRVAARVGALASLLGACGGNDDRSAYTESGTSSSDTSGNDQGDGDGDSSGDGDGDGGDGDGDGDGDSKFDLAPVPDNDNTTLPPSCKVVDDMNAIGDCEQSAPPDAFEPDVQWTFEGLDGETQAFAIPLVANLTDDNQDGEIDLCDTPDIVVGLFETYGQFAGHLYVLDGATGAVHWKSTVLIDTTITPALVTSTATASPRSSPRPPTTS